MKTRLTNHACCASCQHMSYDIRLDGWRCSELAQFTDEDDGLYPAFSPTVGNYDDYAEEIARGLTIVCDLFVRREPDDA